MIDKVRTLAYEKMAGNSNGHGDDHINRVYNLAVKMAKVEGANELVVSLIALLHDVDDYKIVGREKSIELNNAKEIMNKVNIDLEIQKEVLSAINTIGYNKYLNKIRPTTLEGMIVSDADMCDAVGANGIIRAVLYAVSSKGNGRIFDKEIFPNINISYKEYNGEDTTHDTDGVINHFFEKSLKLKNLMLTNSGKLEAKERHNLLVQFLKQFFKEEDVPNWEQFLEQYLSMEEHI